MTINIDGMLISGTMDKFIIDEGILEDYKTCSSWAYVYEESKKKWYGQLNTYAYMLRKKGYKVNKARIIAIFRDWSESSRMRSKDYPPHPIMVIEIKLFDDEFMASYLNKRVQLHRAAENGESVSCTGKERWAKADAYAVMKKGRKKALRVLDRESLAESFIRANKAKYTEELYIDFRPGEDGRCAKYCAVSSVCPQRKARLEAIAKSSDDINK